jgi:hypothetical protein
MKGICPRLSKIACNPVIDNCAKLRSRDSEVRRSDIDYATIECGARVTKGSRRHPAADSMATIDHDRDDARFSHRDGARDPADAGTNDKRSAHEAGISGSQS